MEEDKIVRRADRWSTDFSMADLGIPEDIRHVVGRRLARLSEPTSGMLRMAAACTGGFTFPVLQALTGLADDALLDCIDEGLRSGLIRPAGGTPPTYDFAHAIARHTLDADLNPDRRTRLHRRVATALERIHAGDEADHAAELAAQYHASAPLPGAERGVPYALTAAEQARTGAAHERAVVFLRMARDLAARLDAAERADILQQLAVAEAEALLLADAPRTVEAALSAMSEAHAAPRAIAAFLARVARTLKDGGASHLIWEPLIERGLALHGDRHDLLWARLTMLRDRYELISRGEINAGRWLGHDPEAVAIIRAEGDEDDYADTLEPLAWRTREETAAVLTLARTWRRPTAVIRALDVVVRDLSDRHGAFQEASERTQELLAASERNGSIPGQADALIQLSALQAVLGELLRARETFERAKELVARLGSTHQLHAAVAMLGGGIAYFLDDDWSDWAAAATQVAADSAAERSPAGLIVAAVAARGHFWAGNPEEARRRLALLTPILERMDPRMHAHNGAVGVAANVVWELGAPEFAPSYRRLAQDLIDAGIADFPGLSRELTVARMVALLGDTAGAVPLFARARGALDANGQRPLRAMVDYDEAQTLIRAGSPDHLRIASLLDAALAGFRALGMEGWAKRSLALKSDRQAGSVADRSYPGGLTRREVDVLCLVAGGHTNREIAAALSISVPTVERHIANVYGKIGARNRAEATAYALGHGLVPTHPSNPAPSL